MFLPENSSLNCNTKYKRRSINTQICYSTNLSKPELHYASADIDKLNILKEVNGKSGVYMWTNLSNSKRYIGSSVNLKRRILEYYNVNRLLKMPSMVINNALLKYGYLNFSFSIIEFCEIKDLKNKEKYYFELLKPEYNILKEPGSPSRGKGWKHSNETIEKMRLSALKKSPIVIAKMSASQRTSQAVEVTDLELKTKTTYHAIRSAAKALGFDRRYLINYVYLNQTKPLFGRFIVKKIKQPILKRLDVQVTARKIEVTDLLKGITTNFSSISLVARALGFRQASISLYLKENRKKPFKGRFIIKFIKD